MQSSASANPESKAYLIVMGNEKGGSGKTTTSMHLIASLLDLGFKVGSIDIDSRQRSLTRYLENRRNHLLKTGGNMPMPQHVVVKKSPFNITEEAESDERSRLNEAISYLNQSNHFIIIDCPGSDQFLARYAHSLADTVITPINDSFIDLDVLAHVNPDTYDIIKPSIYSEMLWEQKLQKAKNSGRSMDWIVMRNRLSNLDAKNKRRMSDVTEKLSSRIGFRQGPGFSERVIFRELFLQGMTVIDVLRGGSGVEVSMSHIAAREEVRGLLRMLDIPAVNDGLREKIQQDISKSSKRAAKNAKIDSNQYESKAEIESDNIESKPTASVGHEEMLTAA